MAELGVSGYTGYVLEMQGRVDAAVLARAVRLMMDAEPILGCRFVAAARKPHWRRRADLESASHCRVVGSATPLAAAEAQSLEPRDWERDPVFRVLVFREPQGADLLLFQVDHCVADGDGGLRVVAQTAAIYGRLLSDPGYRPASRDRYDWRFPLYGRLGWRERLRLLGHALAEPWAQARMARHPCRGFQADPERFLDPKARANPAYARLRLGGAELRSIRLAAAKHKAWLNDVLLAALLRAFAGLAPPAGDPDARWRALVFVNLRRYLPDEYSVPVCNLLSNHVLDLGVELGGRFQDTLGKVGLENRKIHDPAYALRTQLLNSPLSKWISLDMMRRLVRAAIRQNCRNGAPPSLSNLGMVDERDLRFGDVETAGFHALGVPSPLPAIAVIGNGFRNGFTFTLAFYESEIERARVEGFFARMREELLSFASADG